MTGLFITFEGTEGSGKSTQIELLADRVRQAGRTVRVVREPGGTPIGEEIRHTLKHSHQNHAMTPEAELLLINASRAQLVREVVRPALAAGDIVLADRFADSTLAYQGYGRQISLTTVRQVVDLAIGSTRPDRTLLLLVPLAVSESRRTTRRARTHTAAPSPASAPLRDRFEEADRAFFERVEAGYRAIAQADPARIRTIDATLPLDQVADLVWHHVAPLLPAAS
jgi:dTMP kinase